MNPNDASPDPATFSRVELLSALFANLVIQQTNMALMFLGKTPHPESGETMRDLDSARLMIDQLEMLEAKTKGNLSKQEDSLLKQSLASLRMSFVEAVDQQTQSETTNTNPVPSEPAQAQTASASEPRAANPPSGAAPPAEDKSRKKFTKKY
ncbi:MAG: DUF1844 domain-containing protein [Verrucomicrobia bacterium]|nr:DUF1844 domain-containing protein [Verrucomicrobiota bacterium]